MKDEIIQQISSIPSIGADVKEILERNSAKEEVKGAEIEEDSLATQIKISLLRGEMHL